ncbi:S60 ribosomal protein L14 [Tieghemostelium lacteum]|uniref:S60 ribosomal protein L14 n=1 Tax=Tieghemostelium lacteum TaxID=361077 RepID=A0A151ZI82_TIELA|nr:S60 ribosomal protein L14 [Tieghemostelium lacteum]|eukprot:KYQ93673.1 S60 ribosomal protein L14 [Tieghemostelium lacteum]
MISKFSLFVQIGRVVMINQGQFINKTAVILDVLDQNRVLVHGPTTGVDRHVINLKWVSLTKIVLPVQRGARSASLNAAIKKVELEKKVAELPASKLIAARAAKSALCDFGRFKLRVQKSKLNKKVTGLVRQKVNEANRAAHKKAVAQKAKHTKKVPKTK